MQEAEETYKTTCCYCGVGCGMLVKKDRKGKIKVSGNPQHPVNKGMLCSKGMNLHYTAMDHSGRLLYPMWRESLEESLKRITWNEAIQIASEKFKNVITTHGPDAVGFYVSGQCLTEEYYLANKIVKGFIGSNNIDTNSRLCMSSAVSAYKLAFGEDMVPCCYDDIELADTFLIAGANPAWCHPILFRRIESHKAKNKNVKIIVVDPRRTQTAVEADLHLQIKPGTDIVLYHAIARGLIENGFIDETFIHEHTEGFKELKQKVMQRTLQEASSICDIKFTDLYKSIKYIGYSGGFISMWAMGLNQSVIGVNKNLALINLSLITGKIGKLGSGPFSLTGQPNAMGGRETGGMANLLSAHRDMGNLLHRKEIADYWNVPSIPDKPGLTATEMFMALKEGKMKAIWIIATNPLVTIPDSNLVEAALKNADFVIVQDMSSSADTLKFAHLVLPAATWSEKEGTMTNSERRISYLSKVIDPPGEALPDAEILLKFTQAMGWEKYFGYKNNAEIFQEHAGLTKNTNINISGLDYEKLKQWGPLQWPVPANNSLGTPRLYTDHWFGHPDGKAKIHAVSDENLSEPVSNDCPLILTTGRIRDQWHTMTRSGKVNKLKKHIPYSFLEIHPDDADQRSIRNNDPVVISNNRGAVQVTARLSNSIKKGVVFLPMHWGSVANKNFARVNNLVSMLTDPISMQPDLKFSAVEVNKYSKPKEKIVIIGESVCVPAFIQKYRELNSEDDIKWISDDPEKALYEGQEMKHYLQSAARSFDDPHLEKMKEQLNFHLIKDCFIIHIDPEKKTIVDNFNKRHDYDQLILAGMSYFPPLNSSSGMIFHWKNRNKIKSIMQDIHPGDNLFLTGDNPALCEAGTVFAEKGTTVHIFTESKRLFENILDETGSAIVEDALIDAGIYIHHEQKIEADEGNRFIFLKDGKTIHYKAIIYFSYESPDIALAQKTGLRTNKGILINEFLQTGDPHIFAIGESSEYRDEYPFPPSGGIRQAECLAQYLYGNFSDNYKGTVPSYTWQVLEMKITILGNILPSLEEEYEEISFMDRHQCQYKKCIIQNDRLTGLIFIGNHDNVEIYRELIEQKTELGEMREQLLQCGNTFSPLSGKIVCSCRHVGEQKIIDAIKNGYRTIAELGMQTGAGTQCGSCRPELKEFLNKLNE